MKREKKKIVTKDKKEFDSIIETVIETELIIKIIENNYYQKQMNNVDNIDVDINHLENIFSNKTYYTAMKTVPLLERKVLYLSYIENLRLNDICNRLKLQKNEVLALRNKAITHFKDNLGTLNKTNSLKEVAINEKHKKE